MTVEANEAHEAEEADQEPVLRRRRGLELEDAICQAAFTELTEVGYTGFTIESVAARAQTGKASIYRRWPTKDQLLIDAFCHCVPAQHEAGLAPLADSVDTRAALKQLMTSLLAGAAQQEIGAIQALASEAARDRELSDTIERELMGPRREQFRLVLARGVARGEFPADAPIDLVAEVIPAIVITRILFRHRRPDVAMVDELVDRLAMPMLRGCRPESEPAGEEQLRDS